MPELSILGTPWRPAGSKMAPEIGQVAPNCRKKDFRWCLHFQFPDLLASKRCIRTSATLHSGQCNVAFGPFLDDLLMKCCSIRDDFLIKFHSWITPESTPLEYARKHSRWNTPVGIPSLTHSFNDSLDNSLACSTHTHTQTHTHTHTNAF